jgi:CBS domain-containing protein
MSPRAAWRLEALGFGEVADYFAGKMDWLANGLPREGDSASTLYAGDLVDPDPPTCAPDAKLADVSVVLDGSGYGFCLVVNEQRIVLGRVRRSALAAAAGADSAEDVMEPGPSTIRPNRPAAEVAQRLTEQDLRTTVVTTPGGRLLGVFRRDRVEAAARRSAPAG